MKFSGISISMIAAENFLLNYSTPHHRITAITPKARCEIPRKFGPCWFPTSVFITKLNYSLTIFWNRSLCSTERLLCEKFNTCVPGSMPSGMFGSLWPPHSTVCLPPFHLHMHGVGQPLIDLNIKLSATIKIIWRKSLNIFSLVSMSLVQCHEFLSASQLLFFFFLLIFSWFVSLMLKLLIFFLVLVFVSSPGCDEAPSLVDDNGGEVDCTWRVLRKFLHPWWCC